MSKAHFDIEAHFGRTTTKRGTLTIDRASNTVSVRPLHGRDAFMLPLNDVADMIAFKVLSGMAFEVKPRRMRRRVSRGLLTTGR